VLRLHMLGVRIEECRLLAAQVYWSTENLMSSMYEAEVMKTENP